MSHASRTGSPAINVELRKLFRKEERNKIRMRWVNQRRCKSSSKGKGRRWDLMLKGVHIFGKAAQKN